MAARTYFDLSIIHPDSEKIMDDLLENNEDARRSLNGDNDPQHWYNHEEDLKEFSKKYPDAFFQMECVSENGGDQQWMVYAQNGKSYYDNVILTYPDFDDSKMV
jgi:hypothetical protein